MPTPNPSRQSLIMHTVTTWPMRIVRTWLTSRSKRHEVLSCKQDLSKLSPHGFNISRSRHRKREILTLSSEQSTRCLMHWKRKRYRREFIGPDSTRSSDNRTLMRRSYKCEGVSLTVLTVTWLSCQIVAVQASDLAGCRHPRLETWLVWAITLETLWFGLPRKEGTMA